MYKKLYNFSKILIYTKNFLNEIILKYKLCFFMLYVF